MKKQIPAILALLSTLFISGSANAHVIFGTREAQPGSYHIANLQIFHGCDGLATHTVIVDIPENITQVRPRILAGWKVSVNKTKLETPLLLHGFEVYEKVSSITWSKGNLPDFAFEQFEFHFMTPNTPGEVLSFPVHQKCKKGRLDWDQKAVDMKSFGELESPAPFITLTNTAAPDH